MSNQNPSYQLALINLLGLLSLCWQFSKLVLPRYPWMPHIQNPHLNYGSVTREQRSFLQHHLEQLYLKTWYRRLYPSAKSSSTSSPKLVMVVPKLLCQQIHALLYLLQARQGNPKVWCSNIEPSSPAD